MTTYSLKHVLGVLSELISPNRVKLIDHAVKYRVNNVHLSFENLNNPHNIHACLRTADNFGIQNIHIIEDFQPNTKPEEMFRRHGSRTTASKGADTWLSITKYKVTQPYINRLKNNNIKLLVSDLGPGALPFSEMIKKFDPQHDKIAFVFGNESEGVSETMKKEADVRWYLPMYGYSQSFNISVANAILLANLQCHGWLGRGNLTEREQDELKYQWILKEVINPEAVRARYPLDSPLSIDSLYKIIDK